MPRLQDKILINEGGNRSRHKAMKEDGKVLIMLADEIGAMGLLGEPEPLQMRDEHQVECDLYDAAADRYIEFRRKMIRRKQQYIDAELDKIAQQQSKP